MHPFVALMRTYCIDYTNSHDQSLYDEIMEPDYVVHISGFDLDRDGLYSRAVADIFERAPGLGLVVHELLLNDDRLCMRFSEHAAMTTPDGPRLACWAGIGLYKWNGSRLTENYVEQDYLAMQEQLATGNPHPLEPPHLDPWTTTAPVSADPGAEATVRAWLEAGALGDVAAPLDVASVVIDDLFSVGTRVPFHVTLTGAYRGGLPAVTEEHLGTEVTLQVAAIAAVEGSMVRVPHAVSTRLGVVAQLTGASPV
jgi:hypothetical protein